MNGVTLVTPTGGRPEAFRLCERWMSRQTYTGPIQWVVVDDVVPVTETNHNQDIVRPVPQWTGQHTLSRNLRDGLRVARNDLVLIIEDDDWYSPDYIEFMIRCAEMTPRLQLIGECPSRYYNVKTRCCRTPQNMSHASLCQTGFPIELVPRVMDILRTDETFVDLMLWSKLNGSLCEGYHCVGIKGMPGRKGIGMGHHPGGTPDPELEILREWIGDDDAWEYAQWAT